MRLTAVSKIWPRACQAENAWIGASSSAAAPPAVSHNVLRTARMLAMILPMRDSRSVEVDVDGVAAERQRQALALGLERERDAIGVGKPQLSGALVPDGDAVAALDIGAGEVAELLQVVDGARGLHLGDAEAADAKSADGEAIALAAEIERAAA